MVVSPPGNGSVPGEVISFHLRLPRSQCRSASQSCRARANGLSICNLGATLTFCYDSLHAHVVRLPSWFCTEPGPALPDWVRPGNGPPQDITCVMNTPGTLQEFIDLAKGIEYVIALLFLLLFPIFWKLLNKKKDP